jgi:hypothetical protein
MKPGHLSGLPLEIILVAATVLVCAWFVSQRLGG